MVSYSLMFCVVRSFLVFSGFGLKSRASGFQFIYLFFFGLVYLTRPPKIMLNSPIGLLRGGEVGG